MLTNSNISLSQRVDKNSHRQAYIEHSPESDQFKKYSQVLLKFNQNLQDKGVGDLELTKALTHMKQLTKKTKYQLKILDMQMIQKTFIPIMYSKGNFDNNILSAKIFLNVAKIKNHHYKLIPEDYFIKELVNLLIMYLNSNIAAYILRILFYLTENKEYLNKLKKYEDDPRDSIVHNIQVEKDQVKDVRSIRKIDLAGFTRVFAEKILDDLSSTNKNLILKTIHNIYSFNRSYMHPDSVEPIMRSLGDKEADTTISALKLVLMYSQDKNYHQQLINTNFIFRLVRIYKQGIVEMDAILVQILLILFENSSLHELLFESKIVFILENYLNSFDSDQNEEVLGNVFEIFKEIIIISEKEKNMYNRNIRNPIKEDSRLQLAIFNKALGLASSTKKEKSILACLSTINLMLVEFALNLLREDEHIKKIIELMPMFFKAKDIDILKYSLSIFEVVLSHKLDYFQENYVKSNDKTFNIKSLVQFVINLINEFFTNYEILSKSCNILIQLSDISLLHNFFLQEPQITIIRVFNDDLITEKIRLIKELERICIKKVKNKNTVNIQIQRKDSDKNIINTFESDKNNKDSIHRERRRDSKVKESFSSEHSPSRSNIFNIKNRPERRMFKSSNKDEHNQKKDEETKKDLEKKIIENKLILKSSIIIVANLTKYSENLEVLTNKGFLDIIEKMLITHNLDALPQIVKCVQGFCGSSASINIILNYKMIEKILKLFRLFKENNLIFSDINLEANIYLKKMPQNNRNHEFNEDMVIYEKAASKLEVLICIRNIVESDIKLQRQFIIDEGIHILLNDVTDKVHRISEKSIDQLNAMILKVIYVISCNINKLFIVFNRGDLEIEDFFEMSHDINNNSFSNSSDKDSDYKNSSIKEIDTLGNLTEQVKRKVQNKKSISHTGTQIQGQTNNIELFKKQLSQAIFMEKLLSIGYYEITSISTYKELIKILINLYLNRYYLKYFTSDQVFEKVMAIIEKILTKYKKRSENNYDIIKLILIFLKFICEEENLIRRFLESSVISNILNIINTPEFNESVDKQELSQFFYNTSLVILRLTEFKGHTEKFDFIKNLFNILENLYDINLMNGKIYIISIIKNILSEKDDFFNEDDIVRFMNKIVNQANTFVIYEFVELVKILVHNRAICKRMENVFKYLINEIKSVTYSHKFKKRILELILCLSYENSNIKDFALHDLLLLIKNLDININKKTTLLILMNFSSVSSNFSYLKMDSNPIYSSSTKNDNNLLGTTISNFLPLNNNNIKFLNTQMSNVTSHPLGNMIGNSLVRKETNVNDSTEKMVDNVEGMTIKKKDLVNIIDHLLDSDRFSQILIQRLLINITSIDNIDLSIISEKIMNVLVEIISTSKNMQESIVIFSLAVLINISNRNMLKLELNKQYDESRLIEEDEMNENTENEKEDNDISFTGAVRNTNGNNLHHGNTGVTFGANNAIKLPSDNPSFNDSNFDEKNQSKNFTGNKTTRGRASHIETNRKDSNRDRVPTYGNMNQFENEIDSSVNSSIVNRYNNNVTNNTNGMTSNEGTSIYHTNNFNDIHVVDYILAKLPHIISIINDLFNRDNLDIASLTIMFACNLSRKIKLSSYFSLETQITNCIDDYFYKNYSRSYSDTESGKFFIIAIIKYCVCLSADERKVNEHKRLFENILNLLLDKDSKGNYTLKMIKMTKQDIVSNNINFVLAECKMKFLNIILEIVTNNPNNINIFEKFNIVTLISNFFSEFIKELANLLADNNESNITPLTTQGNNSSSPNTSPRNPNGNHVAFAHGNTIVGTAMGNISNLLSLHHGNTMVNPRGGTLGGTAGITLNNNVGSNNFNNNAKTGKNNFSIKEMHSNLQDLILATFHIFAILIKKDKEIKLGLNNGVVNTDNNKITSKKEEWNNNINIVNSENINANSANTNVNYLSLNHNYNINNNAAIKESNSPSSYASNNFSNKDSSSADKSITNDKIEKSANTITDKSDINSDKTDPSNSSVNKTEKSNNNTANITNISTTQELEITSNFPYISEIILSMINYDPSKLNESLKSMYVFLLYVIINSYPDKTELNSNFEIKIWLIKLFKLPSNTLQTDYYCIKLFLKSIQNVKFSDIFWKSNKFIKKLANYLSRFAQNIEDEKVLIMKKEAEKILNIISFNQQSHSKLKELNIYNYYKSNLYSKYVPGKNLSYAREDVIFLVNMILNKDNQEFIKDDITFLLKNIFLCKDLVNSVKIQLFENFVTYTLEQQIVKIFKEDYLIIFNLLYENLRENFSDMIILVDNFTKKKKYEHFCKMLVTDDKIIGKIYEDFLHFDKNFPSQFEELNCFFKILEIFINNQITEKLQEIILDVMIRIVAHNEALKDINIVNTILGFVLFFYSQFVESETEINKTPDEDELLKFVEKFKYSELINIICKEALESGEIANIYIISTMILQQEEYKSILKSLKKLNNFIFGKQFMISIFGNLIELENIDIREFVYVLNFAINLTQYGSIECMEEFLKQIIDVYEKFLLPKNKKEENTNSENTTPSNDLNDIITSLYFFCDLIKNIEINKSLFTRILRFVINVLTSVNITDEQKEIMIKYYQEILSHFKINNTDDLNIILSFFLKIHYDKVLNFIENLIMGTIISISSKDVINKNLDSYLQMMTLITSSELDESKILEFFKYIKQLVLALKSSGGNTTSNMGELRIFFARSVKKFDKELKANEILKRKKDKLTLMMK
jgi:hypothetical protein